MIVSWVYDDMSLTMFINLFKIIIYIKTHLMSTSFILKLFIKRVELVYK